MARAYKRDSRGRFARTGALRRAISGIKLPKRKTRHQKLIAKGYTPVTRVYMGDSRGRARKDGKYEFRATSYYPPGSKSKKIHP